MAFFGALGELALGQIPLGITADTTDVFGGDSDRRRKREEREEVYAHEVSDQEHRRQTIAEAIVGPIPEYTWDGKVKPVSTPQTAFLADSILGARSAIKGAKETKLLASDDADIEELLVGKHIEEAGVLLDCPHCGKPIRRRLS